MLNMLDSLIFFSVTWGFIVLIITIYKLFRNLDSLGYEINLMDYYNNKITILNSSLCGCILPWLTASILITIKYLTK